MENFMASFIFICVIIGFMVVVISLMVHEIKQENEKGSYKEICTFPIEWHTSSIFGSVSQHMDMITLKENEQGKRKIEWEGELQWRENPVSNVLNSWKKQNISTEECKRIIDDLK